MSFNNVNVNVSGPVQPASTYKTKVLKGNHSFASQITEPNMKYVIKHDFDLGGETVTIPEGCILEFDGGSTSNGRIICDSTEIQYKSSNTFDDSIFYGNYTLNGELVYNNFLAESLYGFFRRNIFLSSTDNASAAQSICYKVIDGIGYYFVFLVNSSDNTVQKPLCVLFDENFDYKGKSVINVNSHANDATIIDNTIYIASCLPTRNDLDYISISKLKENCENEVTSSLDGSIDLGYEVVSVDYCEKCEELAVYMNQQLYIFDKNLNLKRNTEENLKARFQSELKVNNLVSQGMIYMNGIAYFDFWIHKSSGGSNLTNVLTICAYDSVNDNTIFTRPLNSDFPLSAEPEGMCKIDKNNWVTIINTGTPLAYIIYNINNKGENIIPYLNRNYSDSFYNSERVALYYIDSSYHGKSDGDQNSPYKTLDSAILMAKNSNRTEFNLKKGGIYTISSFYGKGNTIVIDSYGSGDRPTLICSFDFKQANVIIRNVNVINYDDTTIFNILQNSFVSIENVNIQGNRSNSVALRVSYSEVTLRGVIFKDIKTAISGDAAHINVPYYDSNGVTITDCDDFIVRTDSIKRLTSHFIEFYISSITQYNAILILLQKTVSLVARTFVTTEIELDNKVYLSRGLYYWNGTKLVNTVGLNYDAVNRFDATSLPYVDKTKGVMSYSNTIKKPAFGNGTDMIEADGALYKVKRNGAYADVPTDKSTIYEGFAYMLNNGSDHFPIYAHINGNTIEWYKADGTQYTGS